MYLFHISWHDVVLVTEPAALGVIMGRGEGAIDKAFETYAPINKMCDPHGQVSVAMEWISEMWLTDVAYDTDSCSRCAVSVHHSDASSCA